MKNISRLSDSIQDWRALDSLHDDLKAAADLYREEEDSDLLKEILASCTKLNNDLESLEITGLFNGDADDRNAIGKHANFKLCSVWESLGAKNIIRRINGT